MDTIEIKARAKLNLSLDVLGRIAGGYHAMRMVMQTVTLCDEVRLELTDGAHISARSNLGYLPGDERNLAVRAARAFFDAAEIRGKGLLIRLEKRIPVGAGLGGGSADAAAVLRGLNQLTGAGFPAEKLAELGAALGSDIPFCVLGGARLATGRGEILEPLPSLPDCGLVICKPEFSIRTPDLFARIDARRSRIHPDTDGIVSALRAGDIPGVARRMYNVFEDVLPPRCGEIGVIRQKLLGAGALGAIMSGTGSAVFGIFPDGAAAERAWDALSGEYRECFVAAPAAEP